MFGRFNSASAIDELTRIERPEIAQAQWLYRGF